jgi:WD40 repeat protein
MLCKSAVSGALKTLIVAFTIPLLAGCVAEQRLSWSPDGKKLALVGSDGVRVSIDGGIHLGEPVEEEAEIVTWFPDSKRIVVVSKAGCENWPVLEKNVDKEEVDGIKASAAQFLKQVENCNGDFAACRDALLKENFNTNYLSQALFYLNSSAQEKMSTLVGREWRELKPNNSFISTSTIKIFAVDGNGAPQLKNTMARTTEEFNSAKVSPSNEFVFLVDNDSDLCLASTESSGKGFREIGHGFGKFPDWDVNTDVIYGLQTFTKKDKAGDKTYQELVSIDARKPGSVKHLAKVSTLNQKVRATVDGNVIYGSEIAINSTGKGKPQRVETLNMFTLASGKAKRIYQSLKGDNLENFEVSPDGKNVSIPNSNGSIKVITLKDNKTRLIVSGDPKNDKDVFTPVWRNNDEICYENLATKNDAGVVALYSLKGRTSKGISKDWPIEAVTGLLVKPKENQLTFSKMIEDLKDRKNRAKTL